MQGHALGCGNTGTDSEVLGALSVWEAGDVCGRAPASSIKHRKEGYYYRYIYLVSLSLLLSLLSLTANS